MQVLIIPTASLSWELSKLATEGFRKVLERPGLHISLHPFPKHFLLHPPILFHPVMFVT